jgi:transposase
MSCGVAEARPGYVPSELIASYREVVRLHTQLSDEAARSKHEIHALLQVLFPEFYQVFADPCRMTALAVLERYPSARAFAEAGIEPLAKLLHELAPRNYGPHTAEQLVALAARSVSSGRASTARSMSLKLLWSQLQHTRQNLARLEQEMNTLLEQDPGMKGIQGVREFGAKTRAVLRAELGDVERFSRCDQAIAYAGLDITIKESGKWRGHRKLSKRGSGRLRRILYLAAIRCVRLEGSAFGAYYHRLVARGMKRPVALIAVMRKMLAVAYHLLKTQESFDPSKVGLAGVS